MAVSDCVSDSLLVNDDCACELMKAIVCWSLCQWLTACKWWLCLWTDEGYSVLVIVSVTHGLWIDDGCGSTKVSRLNDAHRNSKLSHLLSQNVTECLHAMLGYAVGCRVGRWQHATITGQGYHPTCAHKNRPSGPVMASNNHRMGTHKMWTKHLFCKICFVALTQTGRRLLGSWCQLTTETHTWYTHLIAPRYVHSSSLWALSQCKWHQSILSIMQNLAVHAGPSMACWPFYSRGSDTPLCSASCALTTGSETLD